MATPAPAPSSDDDPLPPLQQPKVLQDGMPAAAWASLSREHQATITQKQNAIFSNAHHITSVAFVNLVDRDVQAAEDDYETAATTAEESNAKAKAAAEDLQRRSAELAVLKQESEQFRARALRDEQIAAGRAQRRDQMREHGAKQKRIMVGKDSPGIVPHPDGKPSPMPPPPPAAPVAQPPPPTTHQAQGWHQHDSTHPTQQPIGHTGNGWQQANNPAAQYGYGGQSSHYQHPAATQSDRGQQPVTSGWRSHTAQSHYGTRGTAPYHPGGGGAVPSYAGSGLSADTAHQRPPGDTGHASPPTLAMPSFSHMARRNFNKGRAKMDVYVYRLLLASVQTNHPDGVDHQTIQEIQSTATYIAGALHVDEGSHAAIVDVMEMIKGQPQDNPFSQRCLYLRSLLRQLFEHTNAKYRDELCAFYMQPPSRQYPIGMYLGESADHAKATGDYRHVQPPAQEGEITEVTCRKSKRRSVPGSPSASDASGRGRGHRGQGSRGRGRGRSSGRGYDSTDTDGSRRRKQWDSEGSSSGRRRRGSRGTRRGPIKKEAAPRSQPSNEPQIQNATAMHRALPTSRREAQRNHDARFATTQPPPSSPERSRGCRARSRRGQEAEDDDGDEEIDDKSTDGGGGGAEGGGTAETSRQDEPSAVPQALPRPCGGVADVPHRPSGASPPGVAESAAPPTVQELSAAQYGDLCVKGRAEGADLPQTASQPPSGTAQHQETADQSRSSVVDTGLPPVKAPASPTETPAALSGTRYTAGATSGAQPAATREDDLDDAPRAFVPCVPTPVSPSPSASPSRGGGKEKDTTIGGCEDVGRPQDQSAERFADRTSSPAVPGPPADPSPVQAAPRLGAGAGTAAVVGAPASTGVDDGREGESVVNSGGSGGGGGSAKAVSSSAEPAVEQATPSAATDPLSSATVLGGKRDREEPNVGGETADGGGELGAEKAITPPPAASAKRSKTACDVSPVVVSRRPVADGRAEGGEAAVAKAAAADVQARGAASLPAHSVRQQNAVMAGPARAASAGQWTESAAAGGTQRDVRERQQSVSPPTEHVPSRQAVAERQAVVEAATVSARQETAAEGRAAVAAAAAGRQEAATGRHTRQQPLPCHTLPVPQRYNPRSTVPVQAQFSTGGVAFQQMPPISTGLEARLPAASVAAVSSLADASAQSFSSMTPSRATSPRGVPGVAMARDTSQRGGQGGEEADQAWARPPIVNALAVAAAAAARAHPHAYAHAGSRADDHARARAPAPGGWAFPPASTGAAGRPSGMAPSFPRVPQRAWTSCSVPAAGTAHVQAPAPSLQNVAAAPGTPFVPVTDSYQAQMRAALAQSMWRGYRADGASSPPAGQTAGPVAVAAGNAGRLGAMETRWQHSVSSGGSVPGVVSPLPAAAWQRSSSSRDAGPSQPGVVGRWPPQEQHVAFAASAAPAPFASTATTAPGLSPPRPATSPRPKLLGKRKTSSPDPTVLAQASPATVSPRVDRPVRAAGASAPAAQPEGVSGGRPSLEGRSAPFGLTVPPPPQLGSAACAATPAPQLGNAASAAAPAPLQRQASSAGPAQGAAVGGQTREGELEKQREQERARAARREEVRRSMMGAAHLHIQCRSLGGAEAESRGDDERSRLYLLDGDPIIPDNTPRGAMPCGLPLPYDGLFPDFARQLRLARAQRKDVSRKPQQQGKRHRGGTGKGAVQPKFTGEWRD